MSIRRSLCLASAAVALATSPVAAQDYDLDPIYDVPGYDEPVYADDGYDGEWNGGWVSENTYSGEWEGTYTRGARDGLGSHLAYTRAERDAWLADCQYLMAGSGGYYGDYYDRGPDGQIVGGLLGAVAGGVIGNRVADGERLGGTLLGAGLGALAGAAIGGVLDGDGDGEIGREELWAARYCDAYLRRYELGGGYPGQAQQVMLVQTTGHPMRRRHRHSPECESICRETVIEEEIVEIAEPAPRPRPRPRPAPRPQPEPQGKLSPIK